MHREYFYHMYKEGSTTPIFPDTTPPVISSPPDITMIVGSTGMNITWDVSDDHKDDYEVWRNGVIVKSGEWNSSEIRISLDGLTIGQYNFTCSVKDLGDNIKTDTVIVRVVSTLFGLQQIVLLTISVASVGIITIVVLLIYRSRRPE